MILRARALFTTALTASLLFCGQMSATFAQAPAPAAPAPAAAPPEDPLIAQIDLAIQANSQRYLVANSNSPWQIFHGLLAYRQGFKVRVGDQKMSAIEWVATMEPQFDRQPLLIKTKHGAKFHPYTRPYAFEGHPAQTLALMSESHLPLDYKFKIGNEQVTLQDFINNTMMEVNTREEITWVLWALINYVKVDAQWVDQWGQPWSMEQLVLHQTRAKVEGGPCGGNHGLFALVRARDKYLATGRPLRGAWLEADQKIQRYIQIARSLQNPDGSFSSEFYESRGFSRDMNERFDSTGHTFEFLSIGLPASQLNEQWVRNAAMVLATELYQHRRAQPSCGPMYHSLNALMNYRNRLRPPQPAVAAVVAPAPNTAPAVAPPSTIVTPAETILPADALRPVNVPLPSATASPATPPAASALTAPTASIPAPKSPVVTGPAPSAVSKPAPIVAAPVSKPVPVDPGAPLKLPAALEAKLLKLANPAPSAPVPVKSESTDPTAPRLLEGPALVTPAATTVPAPPKP